ncbi:MAG: hypothetical protein QNJ91_17760 [Gammaproteobacteria bacterium]|nr:hypothetical protein [Gammaproteobacteria bacterium]
MRDEGIGRLKKLGMIASGALLVLLGVVTFWLPLPIGVPLILLGSPLLLRHSPRARRWWRHARKRLPWR